MRLRRRPADRRAARLAALSATHQLTEGSAPQSSEGLLALARALDTHAAAAVPGRHPVDTARLRDAVRILCAEARAADPVRAERLLIRLRAAWRKMPEVGRLPDHDTRRALWDRVVALCVAAFYEPTPAPRHVAAATTAA